MEILTVALLGVLGTLSSGGLILDSIVEQNLQRQTIAIEERVIRIDNVPSYQITSGNLQKVRLATRGLELEPLRIEALELETDPVALKRSQLSFDSVSQFRKALRQPLQGAVKIVLTEDDLNRALQRPQFQSRLQQNLNRLVARKAGSANIAYELIAPSLELQPQNRLKINFSLRRSSGIYRSTELAMVLKLKVTSNGRTIKLSELAGTVNQRPMSSRLLEGFAEGISDRLNLEVLEADGILARLLQLKIEEHSLTIIGFARVETK